MNEWFIALVTAIAAVCGYLLGINNHLEERRFLIMAQRKKVSRKGSRRLFTAVGNRTQSINLQQPPHRGGWRL